MKVDSLCVCVYVSRGDLLVSYVIVITNRDPSLINYDET